VETEPPIELALRRELEDLRRQFVATQAVFPTSQKAEQRLNRFEIEWLDRLEVEKEARLSESFDAAHTVATLEHNMSPTAAEAFAQGISTLRAMVIGQRFEDLKSGLEKAVDAIGASEEPDLAFTIPDRPEPPALMTEPHTVRDENLLKAAREMLAATRQPEHKPGTSLDVER
jgi:hypothetical protein